MSHSSDDAEARLEALLRANDEATAEEAQTEAAFLTQETIGFYLLPLSLPKKRSNSRLCSPQMSLDPFPKILSR